MFLPLHIIVSLFFSRGRGHVLTAAAAAAHPRMRHCHERRAIQHFLQIRERVERGAAERQEAQHEGGLDEIGRAD